MQYEDITYQIIAAAYAVHNTLGPGFLEKVYADAKFKSLQGPFPKAGPGITKNYLNCGYSDDEETETESDSTAVGEPGDSTLLVPAPAPDLTTPPDTTGTP